LFFVFVVESLGLLNCIYCIFYLMGFTIFLSFAILWASFHRRRKPQRRNSKNPRKIKSRKEKILVSTSSRSRVGQIHNLIDNVELKKINTIVTELDGTTEYFIVNCFSFLPVPVSVFYKKTKRTRKRKKKKKKKGRPNRN